MASAATSRRDGGARRGSVDMAPLRGGGQARAPRCGGAQRPVCCPGGGRADGTGQTPGGRFAWRRTAPIRRLWSRPAIPFRRERDKPSLHTLLLFRELCGGHAGTVPTGGPTAGDRPAPAPASQPPPMCSFTSPQETGCLPSGWTASSTASARHRNSSASDASSSFACVTSMGQRWVAL